MYKVYGFDLDETLPWESRATSALRRLSPGGGLLEELGAKQRRVVAKNAAPTRVRLTI
jgi:hypothetical protein